MKKRILIVDDSKLICYSLMRVLANKGFDTHTSLAGKDALERLERENYELLILDYSLPDMNGLELLKEVREKEPNLPVIFMTGYGSETISVKAFKLGVSDYFIKPFRYKMMVDSVFEILGAGSKGSFDSENPPQKPVSFESNAEGPSDVVLAVKHLKENYSCPISLNDIARVARLSRSHFIYKFKKVMGITFKDYLNHLRIKGAENALADYDLTVSEIAHSTGFNSLRHFERVFKNITGKTPLEYRKGKFSAISF